MPDEPSPWMAQLESLLAQADPAVMALLPDYAGNRNADIDRLEKAIKAEEADVVRRLGHNLKGSGGAYGLPPFSELGARIEVAGRDRQFEELPALLKEYRALVIALDSVVNEKSTQERRGNDADCAARR